MANYIESFKSKMDWGNTFVRTGAFPLDRSSMFSSYEDAAAYAKGDGSDSRGLGRTAYIGQVISVYENGKVSVYKINEDRSLEGIGSGNSSLTSFTVVDGKVAEATEDKIGQVIYITEGSVDYPAGPYIVTGEGTVAKLGTTTASGDLAGDISILQGQVGNLQSSVSGLNDKVSSLESDNSTNKTNISNLQTSVGNLETSVGSLETELDELTNQVSNSITDVQVNGISVVTEGVAKVPGYAFEKLDTAEDGYASTYAFYKVTDGTKSELGKINIPLDQVLRNSSLETVTIENQPYEGAAVGDLYFVFEFQNNPNNIYVPAKKLTDVYVGDDSYINVVDNKISLDITAVTSTVKTEVGSIFATKTEMSTAKTEAISAANTYTDGKLQGYVAKDGDKVLSDNNFTDEQVTKLDGIEAGAEVNKINGVTINGTLVEPVDKIVNISYADVLSETEENAIKAKAVWARFKLVDDNIASKFSIEYVDELPTTENASNSVIYIVKKENADGSKYLEQIIYYNNSWNVIGSTNYATKELASSTKDGLMSSAHFNKLENLTPITIEELNDMIAGGVITE